MSTFPNTDANIPHCLPLESVTRVRAHKSEGEKIPQKNDLIFRNCSWILPICISMSLESMYGMNFKGY